MNRHPFRFGEARDAAATAFRAADSAATPRFDNTVATQGRDGKAKRRRDFDSAGPRIKKRPRI